MSKINKLAHMCHHIDNGGVTLTVNESTDENDDILAGAVASQLGNVYTKWRVKILDHPYPLNRIKNLEKLESYG